MRLCRWDDKENRSTGIRLSVERSPWIESRQFSVVFPSTGCRPDCVISTSRNDSVARVKNQDRSLGVSSLLLFLFATLLLSRWQCLGKSFENHPTDLLRIKVRTGFDSSFERIPFRWMHTRKCVTLWLPRWSIWLATVSPVTSRWSLVTGVLQLVTIVRIERKLTVRIFWI